DKLKDALAASGVDLEEIPRRASGDPSVLPLRTTPRPDPVSLVPPAPRISVLPDVPAASSSRSAPVKAAQEPGTLRSVAQPVRRDINKLDRLMNIVGELAIVRTSLARLVERLRAARVERELAADVHRLQRTFDRHLSAMQQGILEVRMVPLGQVFDKLA